MSFLWGNGFKTPWWLQASLPLITWRGSSRGTIHLTFDDGPTPDVTQELLSILDRFNAKATFFCVGQQAEKFPDLVRQISIEGHQLGNHTFSHLDAWRASTAQLLAEIERTNVLLESISQKPVSLYRPPYGRLTFSAWRKTRSRLKHVMWDVNGQDYVSELSADQILDGLRSYARERSIILLHDNSQYKSKVLTVLPELLAYIEDRKWRIYPL